MGPSTKENFKRPLLKYARQEKFGHYDSIFRKFYPASFSGHFRRKWSLVERAQHAGNRKQEAEYVNRTTFSKMESIQTSENKKEAADTLQVDLHMKQT